MYICVFSRSDGAGRATRRKTRGLTRSVMARMVPPLPAPSRPSNTMITRRPLCFTQSWSLHSSACSLRSSFSYFLVFSFSLSLVWESLLISLRIRAGDLRGRWHVIEGGDIGWTVRTDFNLPDGGLLPRD